MHDSRTVCAGAAAPAKSPIVFIWNSRVFGRPLPSFDRAKIYGAGKYSHGSPAIRGIEGAADLIFRKQIVRPSADAHHTRTGAAAFQFRGRNLEIR